MMDKNEWENPLEKLRDFLSLNRHGTTSSRGSKCKLAMSRNSHILITKNMTKWEERTPYFAFEFIEDFLDL